jgi:hypothetical protein
MTSKSGEIQVHILHFKLLLRGNHRLETTEANCLLPIRRPGAILLTTAGLS